MTVILDELLALYAMSQQLHPYGIDYLAEWERNRAYVEQYRAADYGLGSGVLECDLIGWEDCSSRRGNLYVSIHYDRGFRKQFVVTAQKIRESDADSPINLLVSSESLANRIEQHADYDLMTHVMQSLGASFVETNDSTLGRKLIRTLRSGGHVFIMVDAMEGDSVTIDVPFLYDSVEARSGGFRLAQATRSFVTPLIYDSDRDAVVYGPRQDAGEVSIEAVATRAFSFFGNHVLRNPHRWLHWHLLSQMSNQRESRPLPAPSDGARRYVAALAGNEYLAFDVDTTELYRVEPAYFERELAGCLYV